MVTAVLRAVLLFQIYSSFSLEVLPDLFQFRLDSFNFSFQFFPVQLLQPFLAYISSQFILVSLPGSLIYFRFHLVHLIYCSFFFIYFRQIDTDFYHPIISTRTRYILFVKFLLDFFAVIPIPLAVRS